jgi:tight adherence protein B
MSATFLYAIYAGLFITAMLLIEGLYFLFHDLKGGEKDINRRMKMISKDGDGRAALTLLRTEKKDGLAAVIRSTFPSFTELLWTAGIVMPIGRIVTLMAALTVFSFLLIRLFTFNSLFSSIVLAFVLGMFLPWAFIKIRAGKRQKKFTQQLTPSIDLMVRGLEAGHPITAALSLVADQMPDPIGSEFGIAIDEMTYGLNMEEALDNMALRFPNEDLRYLIVSVQVQRTTGGNLAEILTKLSDVIRARAIMRAKIKAISAEGRFSGAVVGILPFIVGGAIMVLNPLFFTEVSDDPLFWPLIGGSGLLLLAGIFTIWRMIQIKI